MDRNQLLTISFAACKILRVVLVVIFGAYVAMFIHWHINPDFYEHVKVENIISNNSSIISMKDVSHVSSDSATTKTITAAEQEFTLGNLSWFSFYLIFAQAISFLILSLLIIKEIQKVIQSVQVFDSFRFRNVESFRKIGTYCLLFFIVSGFLFAQTPEGSFLGIYFHFTPLGFMLAAYVLAEIFREGNKLYEEQQLTV